MSDSTKATSLTYNPSLDGIRALAATIIVFYHAKTASLTGGFLAVDMFFVLSGYLITSLLLKELRTTETLDYPKFMRRRFNRLVPALWAFFIRLPVDSSPDFHRNTFQ